MVCVQVHQQVEPNLKVQVQVRAHDPRTRTEPNPGQSTGEHNITDELTFTNHDGYVFHDSRGIESGSKEELEIIQNFVREKSTEKRLGDRLHAIWFVSCYYVRVCSLTMYFQVLHTNGQPTAITRYEAF